jgi:uncharacterized membrane protein
MKHDTTHSVLGFTIAGASAGFHLTHAQVNEWLETVSLSIGIVVGIFSLASVLHRKLSEWETLRKFFKKNEP